MLDTETVAPETESKSETAKVKAKVKANGKKAKAKTPKPRAERLGTTRLSAEKVNADELKCLDVLADQDKALTLVEIAKAAWPGKKCEGDAEPEHTGKGARGKGRKTPLSAYRRAVNALRRPFKGGLVRRPEAGGYEISAKGRTFLAEAKKAARATKT